MERQIENLPYTINDRGEITNTNSGAMKVPSTDNRGYLKVLLYDKTTRKHLQYYLHHLVAEYFLRKPDDLNDPILTFKDHNKTNCSADNLIWRSKSEFLTDEHGAGGVYEDCMNNMKKKVSFTDADNTVLEFDSLTDGVKFLCRKLNMSFNGLWSSCCKAKKTGKSFKGYKIIEK